MIPDEIRFAIVAGLCRLVRGTIEFEVPDGTYEIEVLPQPDAVKICFLIIIDAPEPAGPTKDLVILFSHRIGITEEDITYFKVPATHSAIDRPIPTLFSISNDFPLNIQITNNTGETQNFSMTLSYAGFKSFKKFNKFLRWYVKNKGAEELIKHAVATRGRESR